jgi:hypothetical protein
MTRISITPRTTSTFDVVVEEDEGRTMHTVTVRQSDVDRYAPGSTPEALLEASFRFLLEREPKEAILSKFELPVIERYFPDYRQAMGKGGSVIGD